MGAERRDYDPTSARADLIAGLTVAVMLVPQGMAYAKLAGLSPITGLYASLAALVVYALLGSSPHLAVGPVALVSLLTASGLGVIAGDDPARYAALALLLAAAVGVIQLALGFIRAGALVNFLSHPVISGFTSAAALIIGASQLRSLLGLDLPRPESFASAIGDVLGALGDIHPLTAAVGLGSVAGLLAIRRLPVRLPGPLIVVAATAIATAVFEWDARGLAIVGEIPEGLPSLAMPDLDMDALARLAPTALTIALIGYLESVSVAKSLASKARIRINPNRELVALGVGNVAAGFAGGFPVAGGFSRSAVQYEAGAKTRIAGLIAAAGVAVTLLFLTPLLRNVAPAVLAAVIIVAVGGLIDLREPFHAWKISRPDAVAWLITFSATLGLGVEIGIAVGVAFSLFAFIYASAQPHIAELGRVVGRTGVFRNVGRFDTRTDPRVALFRIDGPMYYANAKFVDDWLSGVVEDRDGLEAVVLDASGIPDVDSSAEATLRRMIEDLDARGVALHVATVRGPVRDRLDRSGLWAELAAGRVHEDIETALRAVVPADSAILSPDATEQPPEYVY